MKGDFTKFRFDPRSRFTRVLKQQGRVDLDADWNEYNDIREYLDRTTRIDTLGHYGVPVDGGGFAVSTVGGDIQLSQGRLYIEGIQCELFEDTKYSTQPFVPAPPPINPVDGRVDAVVLDVWERHVTAVEWPSLREVALGGPDTTTRVETIFQVSIAQNVGDISCGQVPFPKASGGQMTPSLVPVPPGDDPCLISPTGGYRGLENRLYRVEIHDPGDIGVATFKWSRDNGSVVFPITEFVTGQPTHIRVARLGRDQVLALHLGDFVEVLGDETELKQVPGTMAQIINIDVANLELTLDTDVSAHNNEKHCRVRRWDQKSLPITLTATPIPLEDGLQVTFSGNAFRVGDWWTFAARTQGQPIEEQPQMPPPALVHGAAGIVHYYVSLALVTWHVAGDGTITSDVHDCRPHKEDNCCCCSVTVGDGTNTKGDFSDLQEAIDSLRNVAAPVEVCLLRGLYRLKKPVKITRGQLMLRGCGVQTVVVGPENGPAFLIEKQSDISLESLRIRSLAEAPAIEVLAGKNIRVSDCMIDAQAKFGWAIIAQAQGLIIERNTLNRGGAWIADGSSQVLVCDNQVVKNDRGPGIGLGGFPKGFKIVENSAGVIAIDIADNLITQCANSGISTVLDATEQIKDFGDIQDLTVSGNYIAGCATRAPSAPYHPSAVAGILLHHANGVRIRENEIVNNGTASESGACGIFTEMVGDLAIADNYIANNGFANPEQQTGCVDFRTKPAGQIANPSTFLGASFTVMDAAGAVLPAARLFDSGEGISLDCGMTTTVQLPRPVDAVTLLVKNTNSDGAPVTVSAVGGNSVQVNGPKAQSVTLSGTNISSASITAGNGDSRGELLQICFSSVSSFQAGIVVLKGFGSPALRICDNEVKTPAGHALIVLGTGPMVFQDNSFETGELRIQPQFVPAQQIAIVNLGRVLAFSKTAFSVKDLAIVRAPSLTAGASIDALPAELKVFSGPILFSGNQVRGNPKRRIAVILPCLIGSFDDVAIENNQFEFLTSLILTHVLAYGFSLRTIGNGFSTALLALYSYFGFGILDILSNNQATYCMEALGFQNNTANNQVLIKALCEKTHGFIVKTLAGEQ